jgi:restriction endonuclease S subunit
MSEYTLIAIGDIFTPVGGRAQFTRDYIDAHPGSYPVYSASLTGPFGYADSFDYSGRFLTWCMNGYAGRVDIIDDNFSATRDRGILVPKEGVTVPDLTYLKYQLEPLLSELAVGRRVEGRQNKYTKIYPGTVTDILVRLPSDAHGSLDYEAMRLGGKHFQAVEHQHTSVRRMLESIQSADVAIPCAEPFRIVSLGDEELFDLSIGERILLSQTIEGGIPVYSASVRRIFGYSNTSNLTDFEQDSLLWGIDWVFDWNLIPAGQKFATTDHCGRLLIKDPLIDSEYLLWALRSTRSSYGFDRVFRASLGNVKRFAEVPIPLDSNDKYDIDRQREIATQHRQIEALRSTALTSLSEVARARLDFSVA